MVGAQFEARLSISADDDVNQHQSDVGPACFLAAGGAFDRVRASTRDGFLQAQRSLLQDLTPPSPFPQEALHVKFSPPS